MKRIVIIVGVLILIGTAALVLIPGERAHAPEVAIEEAPGESADSDPTPAPSPEAPTAEGESGTDAGMEFPIADGDSVEADLSYDKLITYGDSGFEPKNLKVSVGDTVRFFNESGQRMWVGANNHPTHTLYPIKTAGDCLGSSFDQCVAVGTGEYWDFTFIVAGTFGYHNHVRARDGGAVVVE